MPSESSVDVKDRGGQDDHKDGPTVEAHTTDSESGKGADEMRKPGEIDELPPVEAFKWNVDGDQSPFPEVAACVSNTDDPTMLCNTVRAWILMTTFVMLFSGVNQFFGLRYVC
ncbi:unnamed protein product [Aspergillus oryzae RIB40]|uniref:DNA, SC138 n=1 Tax=Aspergillus oryzae (strain ATCC 42149 / RIB 40) TaxID=510516 RepID=Q2U1V4_ASPOR|nr:unnamed protein product [Aspergillus oryzae RIB40]BAE64461.1 unnamed protein product [Aspergillus oryzae RIB40]